MNFDRYLICPFLEFQSIEVQTSSIEQLYESERHQPQEEEKTSLFPSQRDSYPSKLHDFAFSSIIDPRDFYSIWEVYWTHCSQALFNNFRIGNIPEMVKLFFIFPFMRMCSILIESCNIFSLSAHVRMCETRSYTTWSILVCTWARVNFSLSWLYCKTSYLSCCVYAFEWIPLTTEHPTNVGVLQCISGENFPLEMARLPSILSLILQQIHFWYVCLKTNFLWLRFV